MVAVLVQGGSCDKQHGVNGVVSEQHGVDSEVLRSLIKYLLSLR